MNAYETERPDAEELELYAVNTYELYARHTEIVRHILKRQLQNRYEHRHGVNLWKSWFWEAAHMYRHELYAPLAYATEVVKAANSYATYIEEAIANGEYDYLKCSVHVAAYRQAVRHLISLYRQTNERATETENHRQAGYDQGYRRPFNDEFNRLHSLYVEASNAAMNAEQRYTDRLGSDTANRLMKIASHYA